jgi:pyruvate dehydrogenase E1 component beta subunit
MPEMNIIQAVNDALRTEMRRDPRVIVLGEDVGRFGGVFRATTGLYDEFGPERCIDTPLAESGIVGTAIGMALYGLRPVPEIQFADFIYPAYDQIVNELAKMRYRSGGQYSAPLVIRTPVGGGIKGGHYHSQSPEALFIHVPGLKVVMPSNPVDAKGLLLASIRDEDPVIFMEPKRVYRAARGEVPEGDYTIPIGQAKVVREGRQVTVLSWGAMVHTCLEAADKAARANDNDTNTDNDSANDTGGDDGHGQDHGRYDLEIIDLRTLLPFDIDAILTSVKKTGRVVIVHEAPRTCGFGAELAATIQERALLHLEAPILRVTGFDTPFPYTLEHEYLPDADRILDAVRRVVTF